MTTLSPDVIHAAETLAALDASIKQMESEAAQIRAWLLRQHEAGNVPTKFAAAGYAFALQQGRRTWSYPASVTAEIKRLQTAAQELGEATARQGDPFWTMRATDAS